MTCGAVGLFRLDSLICLVQFFVFPKDWTNLIKNSSTKGQNTQEMTSIDQTETQPAALVPGSTKPVRLTTLRAVIALILREMTTTYGRSPGGYIWAIVQPVAMIAILAIGFSIILRSPSLGTSFLLFYAGGFLPLRMFQQVASVVGASLQFNKALLTYPRVTFVDSILARAILAFLTQVMVVGIVLSGVFVLEDVREIINYAPIILTFALAALLGVGIGTFNAFMFVMFPLYLALWQTATRPLILISGVFYLYEDMPAQVQNILWWNPLMHITGLMRTGLYSTYDPDFISIPFVVSVTLVPLLIGMLLLRRYHRVILYL